MRVAVLVMLLSSCVFAQPDSLHVLWDRSGLTDSSAYGYKILPLGDQNHDGYADWAVLAAGNGRQRGYVEFFQGAQVLPTQPYHTFHFDTTQYIAVGAIGTEDTNGDGYTDWILEETRAVGYDVAIFFGSPASSDTPQVVFHRPDNVACFPVEDFNGDGFADLLFHDFHSGSTWICCGGNPMDTIPDWVLHQPPPGISQTIPYAVGDFNGDGASDFMCFNPNSPFNLAVFLGGASPDTIPAYFWSNQYDPNAGIDLNGDGAAEWGGSYVHFGRPILSPVPDAILNSAAGGFAVDAKDFNGDGYHDLILYAWSTLDNPFGSLDLHLGGRWLNPDPVFTIEGDTPPLYLRGIYTAAGLGDVNGDGADDIAIGAWHDWFAWRGRCVILSGDTAMRVAAGEPHQRIPQSLDVAVYPNPFNVQTNIRFDLPQSGRVTLKVFDLLGREVETLLDEPLTIGSHVHVWNGSNQPSGVYFMRLVTEKIRATHKLLLLK